MPHLSFLVLAWLLLSALPGTCAPLNTGKILVKFKETPELRSIDPTNRLERLGRFLSLSGTELHESRLGEALRRRHPQSRRGHETARLDRFFRLRLASSLSASNTLARLRQHPLVEYAELDGVGTGGATIPNDPSFAQQWHHQNLVKTGADVHSTEAWDITTGSSNVIVAVLDTGVAVGLNEFAGRIVPGYDFVNNDTNPADDNGHGTAVAGILCANGNNNSLIAGIDWRCRLMPVKVLDSENFGLYSDWADGIDYAVSNGCKVINLSAGGSADSETLRRAITNAIARGVIFVTITHNQGVGTVTFPGRMPEAITTGATDQQDRRTSFSNFGPQTDLVAPGTNMYTISTGGGVIRWFGTSFSAPLVSGVCALMASLNPNINQQQARLLLALGAEDRVGDVNDIAGFDNYYGWGRLNAYHSLLLARTRMEAVASTNAAPKFSWASPANAADKQPYLIEAATTLNGPWVDITSSGQFQYQGSRTSWSGTNHSLTSYYRLHLRNLP